MKHCSSDQTPPARWARLSEKGVTITRSTRLSDAELPALQRSAGNRAVVQLLNQGSKAVAHPQGATQWSPKSASDINAMQFMITGSQPPYQTFVVERRLTQGQPDYWKVGKVTGYQGDMPTIDWYHPAQHQPMGLPNVTHLNGMDVLPKSGIEGAEALRTSIDQAMQTAHGSAQLNGQDMKMLYTYGATHGGFGDGLECIWGKTATYLRGVHMGEQVEAQANIMWDALIAHKRTTVSAHSRGTIFTDTAVRNVHNKYVRHLRDTMHMKKSGAQKRALSDMDTYIQLIYAGNAVGLPSSHLKVKAFVGTPNDALGIKQDWVSDLFGTSQQSSGTRKGMAKGSEVVSLPGKGHEFRTNYRAEVADEIAADIGRQPHSR